MDGAVELVNKMGWSDKKLEDTGLVSDSLYNVQKLIKEECDAIKSLLLEKNEKYGNSAISPKRIFSKQNPVEQIKVRIDDKLSRIQNLGDEDTDDSVKDLIGYLVLLRIAKRINS